MEAVITIFFAGATLAVLVWGIWQIAQRKANRLRWLNFETLIILGGILGFTAFIVNIAFFRR